MSNPIARYRPSRRYVLFTLLALAGAAACGWASWNFAETWAIAAVLLVLTSLFTLVMAVRPAIEIHGAHICIGERVIFWREIRQVDRISLTDREPFTVPLVLRLTLPRNEQLLILHPGDSDSCHSLLRHIYRHARTAQLDGLTYREFWGDEASVPSSPALPRARFLLQEDEEEVERLFQRLKVAGRLDSSDES